MRPTRSQNGFNLVELVVVIAIIAILAVAVYPLFLEAVDDSRPTVMKIKGREIWLAITSANMEREATKLSPVWPHELRLPVDQGGAGLNIATAPDYFKALMGSDHRGHQLVPDLKPEMLCLSSIGYGRLTGDYPPVHDATKLTANNIAWRVAVVSESFTSADAFLISKDIAPLTRSGASDELVSLSPSGPFKGRRVFWLTRGGGLLDSHAKYVGTWGTFFKSTNNVPFLAD